MSPILFLDGYTKFALDKITMRLRTAKKIKLPLPKYYRNGLSYEWIPIINIYSKTFRTGPIRQE